MYSLLFAQLAFAENLEVTSDVVGAAILINGVETVYRTPATLTGIAPGLVMVTVEKGCNRGQVQTNVVQGKSTTKVHIMTSEEQGTLTVHAEPLGAKISLDGQPFGGPSGAPVPVECGEHSVRVEYDGYAPQTLSVELLDLNPVSLPVSLKKLGFATIELSVTPRDAEITLDGKKIGSDYVMLPSVTEGVHVIGAALDGYQTVTQRLNVKAGTSLSYQIKMKPKRSSREGTIVPYGSNSEKAMMASAASAPVPVLATLSEPEPEENSKAEEEAARVAQEEADRKREAEAEEEAAQKREAEEEAARKREAEAEEEAAQKREAEEEAAQKREAEEEAAQKREAEAKRKAEEEKKAAAEADKKNDTSGKNPATLWSGVGLMGASVAGGAGALLIYNSAVQAERQAVAKAEAAEDNRKLQDEADAAQSAYETQRTLFYATAGLTGALLTTGVVLVLVDDGPSLTPLPGGMLLSWHVRF